MRPSPVSRGPIGLTQRPTGPISSEAGTISMGGTSFAPVVRDKGAGSNRAGRQNGDCHPIRFINGWLWSCWKARSRCRGQKKGDCNKGGRMGAGLSPFYRIPLKWWAKTTGTGKSFYPTPPKLSQSRVFTNSAQTGVFNSSGVSALRVGGGLRFSIGPKSTFGLPSVLLGPPEIAFRPPVKPIDIFRISNDDNSFFSQERDLLRFLSLG